MNAPPYRGVPKPPPAIWAELEAAGATGDKARQDVAREHYEAWLVEQGYHRPQGTNRPDGAVR